MAVVRYHDQHGVRRPVGVSYGANLTPDPDTGLGRWTEKMFVDAMRTGKHVGAGRAPAPH